MSSTAVDDQYAVDRDAVIDEMARVVEPDEWRGGGHMRYAGQTITWGEYIQRRHELEGEFSVEPACMDCGAVGGIHHHDCAAHEREWPEERMDAIGANGPTGAHYAEDSDAESSLSMAMKELAEKHPAPTTAAGILRSGLGHMEDRAQTYDKPQGERSMAATVAAFRATTGIELTEEQGWHFMALLKLVRSQQGALRMDSYEDGAAYFGLMGEAAAKERGQ